MLLFGVSAEKEFTSCARAVLDSSMFVDTGECVGAAAPSIDGGVILSAGAAGLGASAPIITGAGGDESGWIGDVIGPASDCSAFWF